MSNSTTPNPNPACPRCAYDLSAPIPTWTGACPLRGTCPECGLDFEWSKVINAERNLLPWLFEHAGRRAAGRGMLVSFFVTASRSLNPITFWRRVEMTHPIRWKRLLLYVALCYLLMHAVLVAGRFGVAGALAWREHAMLSRAASADLSKAPPPAPNELGSWITLGNETAWFPLWNYGGSPPDWAPPDTFFQIDYYYFAPMPDGVETDAWGESAYEPFGEHPDLKGSWVAFYGATPISSLNAPSLWQTLHHQFDNDWLTALLVASLPYVPPPFSDTILSAGYFFAIPIIVPLLVNIILPFTFITLTTTLGNAGVRAAHFARITAYTLAGLLILQTLSAAGAALPVLTCRTIGGAAEQWGQDFFDSEGFIGAWLIAHWVVPGVWILLAWWMFCRRYLRIPHAFWVALLLSVMAYLALGVAIFALSFLTAS